MNEKYRTLVEEEEMTKTKRVHLQQLFTERAGGPANAHVFMFVFARPIFLHLTTEGKRNRVNEGVCWHGTPSGYPAHFYRQTKQKELKQSAQAQNTSYQGSAYPDKLIASRDCASIISHLSVTLFYVSINHSY